MLLTNIFLARLRRRGRDFSATTDRDGGLLEAEVMEDDFMMFLVSLRHFTICFWSSGILSQELSY